MGSLHTSRIHSMNKTILAILLALVAAACVAESDYTVPEENLTSSDNFSEDIIVTQESAGGRKLCARLYQHSNFRGRSYRVYQNVRFLRGFNDQLSSLRVYRGCTVTLFQHSNYRGRSYAYKAGNYNFNVVKRTIGNDNVSSLMVWKKKKKKGGKKKKKGGKKKKKGGGKKKRNPKTGKVCNSK